MTKEQILENVQEEGSKWKQEPPLPGMANNTCSGRFLFPGDESLEIPNGEFLEIPSPKGEGWDIAYAGGAPRLGEDLCVESVFKHNFPWASDVFYFHVPNIPALFFDHKEARELIEKNLDRIKSEKLVCHWWVLWQRNGGWVKDAK